MCKKSRVVGKDTTKACVDGESLKLKTKNQKSITSDFGGPLYSTTTQSLEAREVIVGYLNFSLQD